MAKIKISCGSKEIEMNTHEFYNLVNLVNGNKEEAKKTVYEKINAVCDEMENVIKKEQKRRV